MRPPPKPIRTVRRATAVEKARWGKRAGDELRQARMDDYAEAYRKHQKWMKRLRIDEKAEERIARRAANRMEES